MTMSKEMQLLRSKMNFYKTLINELDKLNFITKSNNFDKKMEDYQDAIDLYRESINMLRSL